jgi:uncharacterized membrane protein
MHSLLENYLAEVAAYLGPMPAKRRDEELREIRAHLENAVIVSRELGQSEKEAAQNVVAQFGTPQDLGENVVWAWRRGVAQNKRSFWTATGCTFAVLAFTQQLFACLPLEPWTAVGFGIIPLIAAMICGSFFSKRGLAGTAFGLVLYFYGFGGSVFLYTLSLIHFHGLLESASSMAIRFFMQQSGEVLITLPVAWIASRLRLTWSRKKRLARV